MSGNVVEACYWGCAFRCCCLVVNGAEMFFLLTAQDVNKKRRQNSVLLRGEENRCKKRMLWVKRKDCAEGEESVIMPETRD